MFTKSILITGPQGSGKTTKIGSILTEYPKRDVCLLYTQEQLRVLTPGKSIYVYQEFVPNEKQIDHLRRLIMHHNMIFCIETQSKLDEFDQDFLYLFDVIEL